MRSSFRDQKSKITDPFVDLNFGTTFNVSSHLVLFSWRGFVSSGFPILPVFFTACLGPGFCHFSRQPLRRCIPRWRPLGTSGCHLGFQRPKPRGVLRISSDGDDRGIWRGFRLRDFGYQNNLRFVVVPACPSHANDYEMRKR